MNGIRNKHNIGWDELVPDAVCDKYELNRVLMALTKNEKPAKEKPEEKNGKTSQKSGENSQ